MSYSAMQWRAIRAYLEKNNLRPELSAFPYIRFTNKETGVTDKLHITNIEDFYKAEKERAKRDARENAKEAKRQSNETKRSVKR